MEDEINELEEDITSLKIVYNELCEAIDDLSEVEGLDVEYNQLQEILGKIDDEIINKNVKLSGLIEMENENG